MKNTKPKTSKMRITKGMGTSGVRALYGVFVSALPRGTASEGLVSGRHSRIAEGTRGL